MESPILTGMTEQPDPFFVFLPPTLKTIIARHIASLDEKPNLHGVHETHSFSSLVGLKATVTGMAFLPYQLCKPAIDSGLIVEIENFAWLMPQGTLLFIVKNFQTIRSLIKYGLIMSTTV